MCEILLQRSIQALTVRVQDLCASFLRSFRGFKTSDFRFTAVGFRVKGLGFRVRSLSLFKLVGCQTPKTPKPIFS